MIRSLVVAVAAACLPVSVLAASSTCGADALGTSRTLVLKREGAAYGTEQHGPLPLKPGEVVLTFDDGPRAESTPPVLTALADQCVKATFFMVGENMVKNPDLARRIVAEGHSTAMHSLNHRNMSQLSESEQRADLKANQDAYSATLGTAAPAYRFPFLAESAPLLSELKAQGVTVMSVDLGIQDWLPDQTADILTARLLSQLKLKGGGIILMHDGQDITAASLPQMLKALKDNGYRVVHVEWEK
ncbi:polysaccharide deacetylase family protein [Asticcacaulis sp. AND118]|uniref:polysaccharide deacetylase family protein n=1 Tax=Asticcacaulis sp. AND118 TaxID=2840468 RepID=UPI001CFFAF19|nr:polysaccharide deacetylase family protein [Asticcacaulis sp. AND118]UDF03186.1 polysaccharide deacetylase family protein [Asticcacaulis sp. AND118]